MDAESDRRKHPRFVRDETVQLTILSQDGWSSLVRIVDASERGIRIECGFAVPSGTLIKIEGQDSLLLGEVLYSQPSSNAPGHYSLGVQLTRALFGLSELRRLNQSLLAEQPARPVPIPSK